MLERESELAAFAELTENAIQESGGLVVIEGEPGIGKTRLTEALIGSVTDLPLAVLSARAGELEQDYPFGIVRQLYERQVMLADAETRDALFAEAATSARPIFDHQEAGPDGVSQDETPFGALHGLYWLTTNLADRSPLLIVVDDAHWCDAPSLRFLSFLAKRITELPALIVVATRPIQTAAEEGLLNEIASDPAANVFHPTPLSEAAVTEIVRAQISGQVQGDVCIACHEATRGNPFLLRELLHAVRASSAAPESIAPTDISELAPSSVARAVSHRLAQLPPAATALAYAIVVLGDASDLSTACELVDLDRQSAMEAADSLADAEILRQEPELEFVHPIVREAVHSKLPTEQRQTLHAAAARLLDRVGAPADRIATHLLASDPSDEIWVVESLRRGARSAMEQGAPEIAAGFLQRALLERVQNGDRPELLIELGQAEVSVGIPSGFDRYREAIKEARDRQTRVKAATLLARGLWKQADFSEAFKAYESALDTLGDSDPALAERLEIECLGAGAFDLSTFPSVVERMAPFMQRYARGEFRDPTSLAGLSMMAMASLPPASNGLRLARSALAAGERVVNDEDAMLHANAWQTLIAGGEFEEARLACDDALSQFRRRGDVVSIAMLSCLRGHIDLRAGALTSGEPYARLGFDLALSRQLRTVLAVAVGTLSWILLERGQVDEAAAILAELRDPLPEELLFNFVLFVRGRVRAEQGDLRGGLDDLLEAGRRTTAWGVKNPVIYPWRGAAALVLVKLDDRDQALRLVDEEVELARAFDIGVSIGAALRTAALVHGGAEGIELLREATSKLEGSQAKLQLALAECDLGAALRRAGSRAEAREPLRRALDLARQCGAGGLAERAHQELLAAGARPRRLELSGVESLTPSERRVADLAASGRTNREIAQELFVTEKTIERHLSQTYRKLDISSRSELANSLSAG